MSPTCCGERSLSAPAPEPGSRCRPTSGYTAITTQPEELLIGAIGTDGPSTDSFAAGTGYNALAGAGTGDFLDHHVSERRQQFQRQYGVAHDQQAGRRSGQRRDGGPIDVTDGTGTTITPPSGWTLIRRDDSTTLLAKASYYKVATGSEPANHTGNFGSKHKATGGIQAYFNVDTTNPINASSGQANPASTSVTRPSLTTTLPKHHAGRLLRGQR